MKTFYYCRIVRKNINNSGWERATTLNTNYNREIISKGQTRKQSAQRKKNNGKITAKVENINYSKIMAKFKVQLRFGTS